MVSRFRLSTVVLAGSLLLARAGSAGAAGPEAADWPYYGGDNHFDRYSSLDIINPDNVRDLKIVWTRPAIDQSLTDAYPQMRPAAYFAAAPLAIDGILYAPDGVGLIEAFDGRTGKTIWTQKPFSAERQDIVGRPPRGAAYWASGGDRRIISIRGNYLYALDASTGSPIQSFGQGGRVSLKRDTRDGANFYSSGGPLVTGDVIVVGGAGTSLGSGDYGNQKESTPASIRAYDVRTGAMLWEFSAMPPVGDPLRESWGAGSAAIGGDMGSWGQMSADDELGYVYAAFTAPNLPGWGGWRPGDNLYSDTLLALDRKTGRKIWHYQLIHHDVWDRDEASPPVLGDVVVDGRPIKAVMQTGKNALLFAFDRTNGKPLWPIEERPVPQSEIPGEHLSPTQPFPTKPPPLDRVGATEDDLIDFTPELRKEALEIVKDYKMGPLYEPPSPLGKKPGETRGSLLVPGTHGGGSFNTGAFDPETGTYYGVTHTIAGIMAVEQPEDPKATVPWVFHVETLSWDLKGPQGLPLLKPPYGRITAVDMNKGEKAWVVANGEGPRDHPALKGLDLPPLGVPGRPVVAVTKRLLFLGEGSDAINFSDVTGGYGKTFRAYDKKTGAVLSEVELPGGTTGAPITYAVGGQQYVVVAVGGKHETPQWVALSL